MISPIPQRNPCILLLVLASALSLGACASIPEGELSGAIEGCRECAEGTGRVSTRGAFQAADRALLRQSREMFEEAVSGREAPAQGGQVMRVYRWGRNEDVPLPAYAWDANAGERWHVVRAPVAGSGDRESCGRNGVRPIDEFYLADKVTMTVVNVPGDDSRIVYGAPVLAN